MKRYRRLGQLIAGGGRQEGAVTVFISVVTAGVVLFSALFIDFARIAAFNRQLEITAQAGVRSVLSAYDDELYEQYGLFGRGGSQADEIFTEIVTANLEGKAEWSGGEDVFRLLDGKAGTSHVNTAQLLGDREVFRRQILQEMKYKAPIDFTIELFNKLAPLSGAMEEASAAVNTLENLGKLFERRQSALEQTLELQRKAAQAVDGSGMDALIPGSDSAAGAGTAAGIAAAYPHFLAWVAADASRKEDEPPLFSQQIATFTQHALGMASSVAAAGTETAQLHARFETEALQALNRARELNGQMRDEMNKATSSSSKPGGAGGSPVKGLKGGAGRGQTGGEASKASADINDSLLAADQLLLADEWFDAYELELRDQSDDWSRVEFAALQFQNSVTAAMGGQAGSMAIELYRAADQLKRDYLAYKSAYIRPGATLTERKQAIESLDATSAERKRQQAKADSLWKQSRRLLAGIKNVSGTAQQKEAFDQVEKRYQDSLLFNDKLDGAGEGRSEPQRADGGAEDAGGQAQAAQTRAGLFFAGLGEALEGGRDSFYLGEYAAGRFRHLDPVQLKDIFNGAASDRSALSGLANLENQELEYILYGFADPAANLAAAYGELFGVRLAVRTMEGLSECKTLGHPLLVLAAAIVYGLEKAIEDMTAFANKGSAPLSKYMPVELTYLDYLRLFFLVQGDDGHKLSRMIAVIEHNTDLTLSAVPSGVTAEARASVSVWFLPGMMRMLGHAGLLHGQISGGRYETTKTAGWSY